MVNQDQEGKEDHKVFKVLQDQEENLDWMDLLVGQVLPGNKVKEDQQDHQDLLVKED